jgi:Carboxypeptidase regulatory-like domain
MTESNAKWQWKLRAAVVAATLAAFMAADALAQRTAVGAQTTAPNTTGVLRGVAVDSVHGMSGAGAERPLVGAEVAIEGTTSVAVTDSTGAFSFEGLAPGQYRLGLFHPTLDSLGMSLSSPLLSLRAGDTGYVKLATPSPARLTALLCKGGPAPRDSGEGPSILLGHIVDAESDEPVVGARIALNWTDIIANRVVGVRHVDRARDTATGASGAVHLCWLPPDAHGMLHAARSYDGEVVERPFSMDGRSVVLMQLHVPGQNAAAGGATVEGYVIRDDGRPLPGAQVRLLGVTAPEGATTDNTGRFVLHGLPSGSRAITVRAIGYEQASLPVELSARHPQIVLVPLGKRAVVLPAVEVAGRLRMGYQRVGFDRRQQAGLGRFFTLADIERRNVGEFHDLLIGVPGLRLASARNGRLYLVGSQMSGCVRYIVDGHEFPTYSPDDADTFIRPSEIGGVEVYEPGEVPADLAVGPGTASCTIAVIWTKPYLGVY